MLDDRLARRIAHAAGLSLWGTLTVLLESKKRGLTGAIEPHLRRMQEVGMWISGELRNRVLALADETAADRSTES
jgi:predicted nucleic acid-binding protein